ncbi:MAG TPA: nuclear transport factor 2 family protein, partial [Candidatus Thermoplasmatota archaeon]|nr:nuclear transport factor 2 family protein [Candidatus Thermoplasmatota archaeon]
MSSASTVRALYAAFSARDPEAIAKVLADDAVWRVPGKNLLAGEHRGRAAVLAYLGRVRELSGGTFRAEVVEIMDGASRAV